MAEGGAQMPARRTRPDRRAHPLLPPCPYPCAQLLEWPRPLLLRAQDRIKNAKYSGYACYEARCEFRPEEGAIVAYKVYIGRKKYFVLCDIGTCQGGRVAAAAARLRRACLVPA